MQPVSRLQVCRTALSNGHHSGTPTRWPLDSPGTRRTRRLSQGEMHHTIAKLVPCQARQAEFGVLDQPSDRATCPGPGCCPSACPGSPAGSRCPRRCRPRPPVHSVAAADRGACWRLELRIQRYRASSPGWRERPRSGRGPVRPIPARPGVVPDRGGRETKSRGAFTKTVLFVCGGVEVTPCHGREFRNAGHPDGLVLETCGAGAAGCDPIRTRLSRSSDAGGDAGAAVPPVCPDATSP